MPPRRPSRTSQAAPHADQNGAVRLQRLMADSGVASRRECEAMIESGRVEVNGAVVSRLPVFVNPRSDRVRVDGRPLHLKDPAAGGGAGHVYVMLNKPDRTLATTRDEVSLEEGGRRTVLDLVKHPSGVRLFPVGRLEYDAVGLVLLTNDGEIAQRLTHARYGVTKTYRVVFKGTLDDDRLDALRRIAGKADESDPDSQGGVRVVASGGEDAGATTLEISIREGRNRQLTEILERMGVRLKKLVRVGIGPLRLHGLPIGKWRNLRPEEIDALREATGLKAARPRDDTNKQKARRPAKRPRGAMPPPPGVRQLRGRGPGSARPGGTGDGRAGGNGRGASRGQGRRGGGRGGAGGRREGRA